MLRRETMDGMEMTSERSAQALSWWISSLAISVVCCAVLFVVFASYIVDLKTSYATANLKTDMLEQREKEMTIAIENLQHRATVQRIEIVPQAGNAQAMPNEVVPAIEGVLMNNSGSGASTSTTTPTTPAPAASAPAK